MLFRTILTLIFLALGAPAHAQDKPGDDVLLAMSDAYKRGDQAALTQLLPAARGHVLEAWAAYWELKVRLEEALPEEVDAFLAKWAGTYQEDRLRNDWLLLLGKRRDWERFAAEYPKFRMRDDREVSCYALLIEHVARGPAESPKLVEQVRDNWFALRNSDDGCTEAARRLVGEHAGARRMKDEDVWRKARLAMEANRFKAAYNAVELVAPESLDQMAKLNASPTKFLLARANAIGKVRKELIALGLIKLAQSDPDNAAALLENKWGPQLSNEERDWTWGVIAKQFATKLRPDAIDYFGKVKDDRDLNDDILGWKVRAALRAGGEPNWKQVLAATDAMSADGRKDPAWVYWRARALAAQAAKIHVETVASRKQKQEAATLFASIGSVRGFYEQLALEETGGKISVPPRPTPPSAAEMQTARQNPYLQRALYAIGIGLRPEGVREWNYGTNFIDSQGKLGGMSERELLAAAQLACEREVYDRCVNTSERTKEAFDFEQRFPMPFKDVVVLQSQLIGLDPAYVYGLIRQESRFIMDARSHVGASGLMQVMPATARWTARKIGLDSFSADQINDRETNILIGTNYLKLALDDLDGSLPLAAAAYNAGPKRPRAWREGPVLEAAIWAENVPFHETRNYVKQVLANTTMYAAILSGQPQSLKSRLGLVGPRPPSEPEPLKDLP